MFVLRTLSIAFLLSFQYSITNAQLADHNVYTLGNLCDVKNVIPLIESLHKEISKTSTPSTIIFNGDITSSPVNTEQGQKQLDNAKVIIQSLKSYDELNMVVIGGDRDWNDNKPGGYEALKMLEADLEDYAKEEQIDNLEIAIHTGCPGPYDIRLNSYTMMIVINSQWWNHKYTKPIPSDAICKYITEEDIAEEIDDIIGDNPNHNILIAAHHPMRSLGNYGGRFSFLDNMKPFPLIGSFINGYKANVGGKYNITNDRLSRFTYLMYNELYFKSNIIYVSGHEKNHQIHKEIDNVLINSGSLKKGRYSPSDYTTMLQANKPGYIRIGYKSTGEVLASYIRLDDRVRDVKIFSTACRPGQKDENVDQNVAYIPCSTNDELPNKRITQSYATIKPGEDYEYGWMKKLWLGEHHRPTWNTPVTVPYLRISESYRNLTPLKVGGGRQTLSLKFLNEEGKRLTFRSVDKEPRKALNYELRQSVVGRLFEDQTSAQHPFGALPVASMLDHLDILHATPRLHVLPDNEALGPFQETYGGMLGMLEENPGKKDENGVFFAGADDILKSNQLFRKLYDDKKHRVATDEYLRARLFDILVGDWSKHEDNWKWAEFDQEEGNLYRPIPRDRDHAFSKWDGILPWLADREWLLPNTEGFDYDIDGFQSLVFQARTLDRFLLPGAEKTMYVEQAEYIQTILTDAIIRNAVMTMPIESFEIEGELIIEKLIRRREDLEKYALQFFKWINEDVAILGSAEDDVFEVYNVGSVLHVDVYKESGGSKKGEAKFQRTFANEVTDVVRIYGLGEEDIYNVDVSEEVGFDIFLLGGPEVDIYNISNHSSDIKVIDDENDIDSVGISKIELQDNWQKQRYRYNRKSKQFDSYLPLITLGYNRFFGTSIRSSTTWTKHRWDKLDYHMSHNLRLNVTTKGDYGLRYLGDLRQFAGKWDLTWSVSLANPDFFDSYYGQGNFSIIDPVLDDQDYYITTFNNYQSAVGVRRLFWGESFFEVQSGFDYFINKELENTILTDEVDLLGVNESLGIVQVQLELDIDFRDNRTFPKKGSRVTISNYNGIILNRTNDLFATVGGTIEQYFSTYNYRPVTIGMKVGGVKGISEVPFYLQPRLGGNSGLRGYTSNRFFGRSMIYFNSEVRWQMFKDDEASIPYEFGVSAFYDVGKVSNNPNDDLPTKWHSGYGAGIFFVPFDERFTLSIYLQFSEENTYYPRFTIGTSLN